MALNDIVDRIFGEGDLKGQALKVLNRKLTGQRGRSGAGQLAVCLYKSIADAQGISVPGTVDQRIAVGEALAQASATAARGLADSILAFHAAQSARERARGTETEAATVEAREKAERNLTTAAQNIARAAIGQAPEALEA